VDLGQHIRFERDSFLILTLAFAIVGNNATNESKGLFGPGGVSPMPFVIVRIELNGR
jgi:hypothetical protein